MQNLQMWQTTRFICLQKAYTMLTEMSLQNKKSLKIFMLKTIAYS